MTHEDYKKAMLWKMVMETKALGAQCVAQCKDYCKKVRWYSCGAFGWSAYTWRLNRAKTFPWKKSVVWFSVVPVWSVVIFKPYASLEISKPWSGKRSPWKLWKHWHVAIVDYIDDSWVIRTIEQNGGQWDGDWLNGDEIRLRGYKGKASVAGFILK